MQLTGDPIADKRVMRIGGGFRFAGELTRCSASRECALGGRGCACMQVADVPGRPLQTVLAVGLLIAALFYVVPARVADTPYLMADELVAQLEQRIGQHVRVHGFVVPGSIDDKRHTFVLARHGHELRVYHPTPTSPRETSEVVVTGRVTGLGLDAVDTIQKCDDIYAAQRGRRSITDKFQ